VKGFTLFKETPQSSTLEDSSFRLLKPNSDGFSSMFKGIIGLILSANNLIGITDSNKSKNFLVSVKIPTICLVSQKMSRST
jgi:hypothetical protein